MNGHWWTRALAALGLLIGVGVIAALSYHAGAMHPVAAEGMRDGYRGGYGFGFFPGFLLFRFLFGIFFILLLVRLFRFAVFGPRHWGYGWRGGPGGMGMGGGRWDRRREMLETWHRDAHAEEHGTPSASAPPVAPTSSDPQPPQA